jgi:hypothetical protein
MELAVSAVQVELSLGAMAVMAARVNLSSEVLEV